MWHGVNRSTDLWISGIPYATSSPVTAVDANAGSAPRALSMTTGCGGTDAFIFDEQGIQLIRDSVALQSPLTAPTFTRDGSISLDQGGFSAASEINYGMFRRFVLTSNTACEAAVLAPVVDGQNADQTTAFHFALALVDGATMTQFAFQDAQGNSLGNFFTDPALTENVKNAVMAPDGSAVYVEIANADGTIGLCEIDLTPASGSAITVTTKHEATIPSTDGFVGTSMIMDPNGKFIDFGMRDHATVRVAVPLPVQ